MNYKILVPAICLLNIQSCGDKSLKIEANIVEKYIKEPKAIIVCCTRCQCVNGFLKDYSRLFKNNIPIYADSNCTSTREVAHFNHLSQRSIDSIYERNYNMLLIKKENDKIRTKLLKTEEQEFFEKDINAFFGK